MTVLVVVTVVAAAAGVWLVATGLRPAAPDDGLVGPNAAPASAPGVDRRLRTERCAPPDVRSCWRSCSRWPTAVLAGALLSSIITRALASRHEPATPHSLAPKPLQRGPRCCTTPSRPPTVSKPQSPPLLQLRACSDPTPRSNNSPGRSSTCRLPTHCEASLSTSPTRSLTSSSRRSQSQRMGRSEISLICSGCSPTLHGTKPPCRCESKRRGAHSCARR